MGDPYDEKEEIFRGISEAPSTINEDGFLLTSDEGEGQGSHAKKSSLTIVRRKK